MGYNLAIRSSGDSRFQIGVFSNKPLIGSFALTFALQIAVIYWPPLQNIFRTTALSATEFAACVVLTAVVFGAVELQNFLIRLHQQRDVVGRSTGEKANA